MTGLGSVDLVKIDTEGAELSIFEGAETLLERMRPLILCEVLDQSTRPWGYPACKIIARLRDCGYTWFEILRDGNIRPHFPQSEYPELKNYLAVPEEAQHRIEAFRNAGERSAQASGPQLPRYA